MDAHIVIHGIENKVTDPRAQTQSGGVKENIFWATWNFCSRMAPLLSIIDDWIC